jgi:hypothetical protein
VAEILGQLALEVLAGVLVALVVQLVRRLLPRPA